MKKLFSFIMVALMSIMTLNAETTRIYCKMAQSWWKADGAAVGCHSWGTPGPGTDWPGVRMTPVEGETDMWYIDLDVTKVQNVIFTRVNPSGDIADWGAKTGDLVIPTNGDNLFTITKSSACWSGNDCTCDGEWSVYGGAVEKPKHDYTITAYLPEFCAEIEKYADSARVMGGFDDWSNGIWMEKKIDEDFNDYWYAEIKDVEEGTEFKLRFGTDADWKVQVQLNGANMANEAFGETTDIVLHYDGEGYGFAACAAPATQDYYLVGYINGANVGCDEDYESLPEQYKFVNGSLTTTFTETSYVFVKTGDNNHWFLPESYVAPAAKVTATLLEGKSEKVGVNPNVEVTFTLTENVDGTLTLSYEEPVITYKDSVYYVAGNFTNWAAEMKNLPAEVSLPADSALEFKQVLLRTVLADGDSVRQDTIWYGQPNKGNFMTRDNSTWKLDGAENVLAMTDIAGIYTFDLNESGEFVLGWPKEPVITYKDSVYYVAGNFTGWASEMKKLPAEVALPADSTIEFKQVLLRTVLADGDSVRQDTIWYGQLNKGYFMTRDNSTWKLDGAENVLATTDIAGKYVFSMNEKGEFVITWPKEPVITYADSVYYVAGNFTNWAAEMKNLPAEVALPADSTVEFKQVLLRTVLADGDSVRQDTIWYGQPNKGNFMTRDNSTWKLDGAENVLAMTDIAGIYTFDLNESGEFVLGWPKEPVITYKDSVYYVAGNFTGWASEMQALPYAKELPADSILEFKEVLLRTVLADGDSVRQDTIWYGQLNKGYFMTRDNSTWKLDGAENVLATTDIAGKYVFSMNEKGEFVLGWPEMPIRYYAKNNWGGAEDWSWKEMTKVEDLYVLDSVIFGGTGVNINTKEEDTDAKWFALKDMTYVGEDTIQALDTVRFELAISKEDTVLTAIKLGRPAPVARKEFVFVAGEAAEANPALFAITWGKDGSNETVKLANKADDIYTAEILETVDSVVLVRCASDATEIIWDGEGKNVWNQTANYELCDTMSFVAWVEETNLFAVTCDTPKPVETKYYAKNNWNNGDWSWLEMTKVEDLYVLDSVIFGGTGVNINTKEEDTDAKWFALKDMTYVGEDTIQALDTVRFELAISKEDTVLTAIKLGRPAPAARKEFVFVAGEVADANPALFAITWGKDGSNETVKLANKADDIYTAEILETVDSVVLVRCATGATEIIWGEGTNVWNQTANYELCDTMSFVAWVEETNLFTITCDTPKPVETKYYAKNNWNNGDWSWLEMTKVEDLYVLDSVIFGGTGVNINTKEEDTDAKWFALKDMTYVGEDTIQALDTVRFELAISKEDTVLTAIKLGRPAPVARKEFVFVAGEAAEANPAMFAITWGKDGSNETVKMTQKGEEALYTANILETVDSVVLVRCASDATEIIWDGEGKNVWNQTANYELCDTMSFVAWVEETNLFTITCDTPKPVGDKYYVTGNAALVGEEKAWKADAIEMVDYTYTFPMLAAGEYQLKVTDGTWEHAWGYDNLSPTVAVEGLYTDVDGNICFTVYTPNDVTVTFAQGYVVVTGDFTNPTPDDGYGILLNGTDYIKGEASEIIGGKEYKVVLDLVAGNFVQLYDGANHVAWVVNPEGLGYTNFDQHDGALYIKENGNYQFYVKIFTNMTSGLYVGFTTSTGLNEIMLNAKDGKFIINGKMIIRRNGALYTIQGARL